MRIRSLALIVALLASPAAAAPTLRSADIHVTMMSPLACEVWMTLAIDEAGEVDHRIESDAVDLTDVQGAEQVGQPRLVGRTRSLVLKPHVSPKPSEGGSSYTVRYRSTQPEDRAYRCPIWLPAAPTDGISRVVRFRVDLPASVVPGDSMPAMTWTGTRGTATLGHVPAFVRLPYVVHGESPRWSIAQVMDAAAIAVFAAASALWLWRRRR